MKQLTINDELARAIRNMDRGSKACLNDSIASSQHNVGAPALAVLYQQAKANSETFIANEPVDAAPPEFAKAYLAAAGRYTQAALNFHREWQHKTVAAVVAKCEQLDAGDPKTMFQRLNAAHAAQTSNGAVSISAEAEWLEWQIAYTKLTLDHFPVEPPTLEERRASTLIVSEEVARVRAQREQWAAADLHPHPIMLADLLAEGMQAIVDEASKKEIRR